MIGRRIVRAATIVAVVLASCGGKSAPDASPSAAALAPDAPSVLLVSLDTVRADHLGCYGHAAARTPNLDALAKRGVRFERAYAHTPYTLPSHATLLTGLYPAAHGVHVNFQGAIAPESAPIAESLAKIGYRTAAFVASSVLDRRFGLARGFGSYDDLSGRPVSASEQVERPANEVADAAIGWLSKSDRAPFFAWVHFYDAHDPYAPPEGFRDLADPYDGEIAFVDAQLGRVLAALERAGRLANTVVVVVADHGEAFGEHGEEGHGLLVYDTTMHVPMIFAGPAPIRGGAVAADPVGLVDVVPTLLDLLRLPAAKDAEGASFLAELRGEAAARPALWLESEYPLRSFGWAPLYGVVSGAWKYVQAPTDELFDLAQDPGEEKNLGASDADVRSRLAGELENLRRRGVRRAAKDVHLGLDARNALSKLGYVEGEDVGDATSIRGLADPKTMTKVALGAVRARAQLRAGDFAGALATAAPLVEASPQSGHLWQVLGSAQLGVGRAADAIRSFERSLATFPKSPERLRLLGDALLAAGRPDDALARYRAALDADPQDGQSESRLGLWFARAGKPDEALQHFQRFAELEPSSPNAQTNLANALFSKGRFAEGVDRLQRAIALDPRCTPAYRALYMVRKQRRERDAAIAALRAAVAALPDDASFRAQLAWELAAAPASTKEAWREAETLARAAAAQAPQDPTAPDALGIALAREGDLQGAIESARSAAERARSRGDERLAAAIEARIATYGSGKSFVE
jgi:arylsulfatase A-like enzyme/tetratricopeptide (TPR) repeat protein